MLYIRPCNCPADATVPVEAGKPMDGEVVLKGGPYTALLVVDVLNVVRGPKSNVVEFSTAWLASSST